MNAYTYALYQSLGIFIALIVTNCIVAGRAEAFASQNSLSSQHSMVLWWAWAFLLWRYSFWVVSREILGRGTLFAGADILFGSWASALRIDIYHSDNTFLLAILPPGAFLVLGCMIALKNVINARFARKKTPVRVQIEQARTTTFWYMNKDKRRQILERLREANPHPTTELEYATPFELLIAVILSAQATDISVNKATPWSWHPHANTPETILALGVDGLKNYIKTVVYITPKQRTSSKRARSWLSATEASFRKIGQHSKHCRSWQKNSQRCAEYRLWLANHCCWYPYIPGCQPNRFCSW